ncbi:Mediator of RNA polymerase II transcription subunit-like protein [Hapsidospora chrysogenum ATCC 11550]|uniref:Mediator of RNA polymerase II transcription subunit 4 n=1 Tax=Hapsidospora chrysogenum (strain ATCC 11550 / CBS 779.69 / DSM 880 / IAM 14645 / JCM 23072 / IMI 49137) TaxID=857340 RepID=A0A086SXK8_HAPC1|nr:Mediator of RNA polymerase II transcription subunit-like protein [Hapsidospora chrysogenum ATCC 11550]
MDTYIDGRFERLEKALANLIDSVNKYHPSTVHAKELEAADEELTKGLEQIQAHQVNYLRVQQLRKSSAALDTQIKDTLTSLASTRRDITNTRTTTFPAGPNYPVAYDELLSYARRISKTTMPPAGTLKPPSGTSATTPEIQTPADMATPSASAAPTPSQPLSPAVNGASTPLPTQQAVVGATQQSAVTTNTSLPDVVSQYLNPLSGQLFFPWPLEDKIRNGALASNQILAEKGIDPRGYDPAEEEERQRKAEEEQKEREEQEKRELEERERRLREERERQRRERERQQEEWRKASMSGPSPERAPSRSNTGEKKQFQFRSLDDDLDEDDED